MEIQILHFFDATTFTLTYLVIDKRTRDSIIIDPVLDFEAASGKISDENLQNIINTIKSENLDLKAILETHAHADHLSGSQILKQNFPDAVLGIGERIKEVQAIFKDYFQLDNLVPDGRQFDYLFKDFEIVSFGKLKVKAIPTPGHTPACMSYLIDKALFVGDALFIPDYGTGRCDFPKGSAKELYHSVYHNLYSLPDEIRVFVGHDYSPNGRNMQFETTIGESKKNNIQLNAKTTEEEFIRFREVRDKTLKAPSLLLPSIQVNINAGHIPHKEDNKPLLKLPLKIETTLGTL